MARRYEFSVRVARTISHSFAAITRETLLLPREHKIHIFELKFITVYRHTRQKPFDVIYRLYKMKHSHWLLLAE